MPDQPFASQTAFPADCSGHFLVASPYLTDGHFFRSVVLIIRHSSDGAFGVVVNRLTDKRFRDAVEMSLPTNSSTTVSSDELADNHAASKNSDRPRDGIYLGGPVEGPLLALHDVAGIGDPCGPGIDPDNPNDAKGAKTTLHDHPAEAFGSMSIQWANVPAWLTADEDHLRLLARREDARLKFVVGYSGWGPGQLEHELQAGGWLVVAADSENIFDVGDELWQRLVKRCGQAIMRELSPDLPAFDDDDFDPRVN